MLEFFLKLYLMNSSFLEMISMKHLFYNFSLYASSWRIQRGFHPIVINLHIFLFFSNSCHLLEIQLELERGYINFCVPCLYGTNVHQCNCSCCYCWSILGKVQDNHLDVTDKCSRASIDDFGCNSTNKITSNVRTNKKL